MRWQSIPVLVASLLAPVVAAGGEPYVLDQRLHHLRLDGPPEWSDFPPNPEKHRLEILFQGDGNLHEYTLRLRQQDVKQPWRVLLNQQEIGRLLLDENDTVVFFPLPTQQLKSGQNALVIEQIGKVPDDIRVGELIIEPRPLQETLSQATIEVRVQDATEAAAPRDTPCRITVVNVDGALVTTAAVSGETLAVRPGVIYTSTGRARIGVPAGKYTIYAGRGFEYGIDSANVSLAAGERVSTALNITRQVPTPGYVSCDTHIHTLTHSGHGDATIDERMITLAGEGIELPIATDHNRHIDYEPIARKLGARKYFTPVVGNEVTTALGHFNIFPVATETSPPSFQLKDGNAILDSIAERTAAKAVILNHPRDVHSGFRPFGPERHNAATGENQASWLFRAAAVELVNSGAQQTDILQTYRDWFALLNRGTVLTPVGASDSHDVSRFIVGQSRTYIRCHDDRPDAIDVREAVTGFVAGRVLVSCGLLVDMTVNDKYLTGDIVPRRDEVDIAVRVLGPAWTRADRVILYANGTPLREERINDDGRGGLKWSGHWTLPPLAHDIHLVAVAIGPGVTKPYWPIAKPYQPASPRVDRRVIGSTGAIWVDADGDGRRTSALKYAQLLISTHASAAACIEALADFDEAVAAQTAGLLHASGVALDGESISAATRAAGPHVERGFAAFFRAWRQSEVARTK